MTLYRDRVVNTCPRTPRGRVRAIQSALDKRGDFIGEAIWPKLGLILLDRRLRQNLCTH